MCDEDAPSPDLGDQVHYTYAALMLARYVEPTLCGCESVKHVELILSHAAGPNDTTQRVVIDSDVQKVTPEQLAAMQESARHVQN
jgi:hypothetical protein